MMKFGKIYFAYFALYSICRLPVLLHIITHAFGLTSPVLCISIKLLLGHFSYQVIFLENSRLCMWRDAPAFLTGTPDPK